MFDFPVCRRYINTAVEVDPDKPVLVDKYLDRAIELDVDALRDQEGNIVICGIMEHIEQVRLVHSSAEDAIPTSHTMSVAPLPSMCYLVAMAVSYPARVVPVQAVPVATAARTLLQAGVHSGDSACTIPTQSIPTTTLNIIREWTHKVAEALNVVGLINIQYAIQVRTRGWHAALCCRHPILRGSASEVAAGTQ